MNMLRVFIVAISIIFISASSLLGQDNLLGKIDFPNSGAPEAQADFMEGMLFLHNFEYEDAARAFKRAREKDPDFMLAYYGEAKTHNHPIWMEQDREAAMSILQQLGSTYEARRAKAETEREKDYLHTLEVLYGNTPGSEGKPKEVRDDLYREAMKKLYQKYPEDHEATAFYGLSILGTAHEGRDFGVYMQAAAVLLNVWNENQKHPGAAHYLIHSFDDPVHAPLGLPMAKAYSEIAPSAAHAQHMTSHIFLALGMWEDVVDANIVARDVQTSRQRELDEQTTVCGHYPWWLQYGYLQEGNAEEAATVLRACESRVNDAQSSEAQYGELWHFSVMRAHQIIDSKSWSDYTKWTTDISAESASGRNYFFTNAYAALQSGDMEAGEEHLANLKLSPEDKERDIQIMQIEGLMAVKNGNVEDGLAKLEEAVADEFELPIDFGPPTIVKPSAELLADVLLEQGMLEKAMEAYDKQLERTPKRRQSLLGKEQAMGMAAN